MNPIESLRADLIKRFPEIDAEIDVPGDAAGLWVLDVRPGGDSPWIVVEWKPDMGFGVSTPGPYDFGMKPDELYPNTKAAYDRVVRLVLSRGRTEPPTPEQIAELKQFCQRSREDVASRAGLDQPVAAGIEACEDIMLSTLHRVVSAMGGALSIRAEFPDGTARELTELINQKVVAQSKTPTTLASPERRRVIR